jgi:hypothetical protein
MSLTHIPPPLEEAGVSCAISMKWLAKELLKWLGKNQKKCFIMDEILVLRESEIDGNRSKDVYYETSDNRRCSGGY